MNSTRAVPYFQAADESSQSGQRLLAAASHTDEQSVAARGLQNTVDATDVHHGVLEQHQVHGGVQLVVCLQSLHKDLVHISPICARAGEIVVNYWMKAACKPHSGKGRQIVTVISESMNQ